MSYSDTIPVTSDELLRVDELRKRVEDILKPHQHKDELMFIRFLRARNGNLNKAEDMLRNHLQWRQKNSIDDILYYNLPEVVKYFPLSFVGYSKMGNPVRYISFGTMDSKGLLKSVKKMDAIKTVVKELEIDSVKMKEITEKQTNKDISQWIYIFDFDDYSFSKATHKPTAEMFAYLMMTYEAHYPERLKYAYAINASVYFTIIFSVIKPLFTGATLTKIKIFGKDGWKEDLQKHIDPEQLPVFLGGTKVDPDGDPQCPSFINPGGIVPHSYYFRSENRRLCFQPGVKKLQVSRMSKVDLPLDVEIPGSHIEWEFETESRDIAFGLYYRELDSLQKKPKELIPKQRVEAHTACETGMYQCEIPGTYILMFDNSYSWLQQKEVFCRAVVVRPNGERMCDVS